jgi:hypothetical protein
VLKNNPSRTWNICAAAVVLVLALSSVVQDSFHRSYLNTLPPGIPIDFPHYYVAGRLARLRPPANLLYYAPAHRTARSITDLRIDATTPYGRASEATGISPRFVTRAFIAPPFTALMMEPLALLPWRTAYLVWQILGLFMMLAAVWLTLYVSQGNRPPVLMTAIASAVVFLFTPFRRALGLGNIDVLIFLLWVLGIFLLQRRRVIPSAFCLALATAVKLSPVYAVPLLAMRRQWRWLAAYGVWSGILLALSVWGLGWQNHVLWVGQVAPAVSSGLKSYWNRSLTGLLFALIDPRSLLTDLPAPAGWALLAKVVGGIGFCGFLFWCWKRNQDSNGLIFEMSLLPVVVVLVSPVSWSQYYVLAILPLAWLWAHFRKQPSGAAQVDLVICACCTLVIGVNLPEHTVAQVLGPFGQLCLMAMWVAATVAILWLGMRMYSQGVAAPQSAVGWDLRLRRPGHYSDIPMEIPEKILCRG